MKLKPAVLEHRNKQNYNINLKKLKYFEHNSILVGYEKSTARHVRHKVKYKDHHTRIDCSGFWAKHTKKCRAVNKSVT